MTNAGPHVLIAMSDEPDCRMVAAWLTKAAEAQENWSRALCDPDFSDRVLLLHIWTIPDLAAFAVEILAELDRMHHVAALDLYADENGVFCVELTMLVQLGFFVWVGGKYLMAVPEKITFEMVTQAALDLVATESDCDGLEVIQPERLLQLSSQADAEAWRARMIEMRHFDASAPGDRTIQ